MKRLVHTFALLALLLAASVPALAQNGAQATPEASSSFQKIAPTIPEDPFAGGWVESTWLLAADPRALTLTGGAGATPAAAQAPALGGDWSNGAAWACISPLAVTHNVAFGAGLALPPPTDFNAAMTEYAANLGLKFCAPVLYPPGDLTRTYDLDGSGQCGFTFNQKQWAGEYKNYLGFTLPWGDVFPGKEWGDFGQPAMLHWNTDVQVTLYTPAAAGLGGDAYRLPVGVHTLTWRGDTLLSALDVVPRYIPGWAWTRMNKLLKLKGLAEEAAETTLESVIDLAAGEIAFIPNWPTMYNEEIQRVAVVDQQRPNLSGPASMGVEAIGPGGVSRRTFLAALQRSLTVTDNCDAAPEVFADNEFQLPEFAPVGSRYTVQWVAEDRGPYDLSGARNRSPIFAQTFEVRDTLPPIVLPPPDIVTEAVTLPATLDLGNPGTFDLADLNPAVSHNACSLPGVVCEGGVIRFPAGKTTVTWTAVDHAGNRAGATQYVNVKGLGSNRAPTAAGTSGRATSYEPLTLTLRASDPDGDRLWFEIEDQPDHGFFRAPLYPYFIQDYRLANVQEVDFGEFCRQEENRGQYVLAGWPVDARFMAVADDGRVFVQDQGLIRCLSFENGYSKEYRLAIFRPDGTWDEALSSFDVKDMEMDWENGRLYTSQHNIGGTFSLVRVFDLNLNLVASYRTDSSSQPFREPRNAAIDFERSLLYVTNGYQYIGSATLWVMKLPPPGSDPSRHLQPEFLAEYTVPGGRAWQDLQLDSAGNLYASERDGDRIYKWSAPTVEPDGRLTPGELMGWMGRCDSGPGCDVANGRSFGYSCTDLTCSVLTSSGSGPGQFNFPRAMALDNNDILYATDYNNRRVQRFTPDGYFAGQAISECDGSCFVLGDFGSPRQVTVNSSHFYVLDDGRDLLHVFETTPITRLTDNTAEMVYQSDNNFVGTDTFSFRAGDGLAHSPPETVTIDVRRNHRPPVATGPLVVTTLEDNRVQLPVDGYDPDEPLDTVTFTTVDAPANGRFLRVGETTYYEPDPDFEGSEEFSYAASDGRLLSAPQPVSVTVTAVNDPPRFPEDSDAGAPSGFALRPAEGVFSLGRLAPLGTAAEPLRVGRGYNTVFTVVFEDPDRGDVHTVRVDWGDGSPVEAEGRLLEDGSRTGPVLSEGVTGGAGTVTAEHAFHDSGSYTVRPCVSDNVAVDGAGNKSLTAASTTTCTAIPVTVAPMVDLVVDIRPSANPYPAGDPLYYDLVVTNQAPEGGGGLTATGVVVTDALDTRLRARSAGTDAGDCTTDRHLVTCTLAPLAPGASAVIRVDAQVPVSIQPGMVLANHVTYRVDQEDQADAQENGDLLTVVAPAHFVVNTIADEPDAAPGDGVCGTATEACSLRAAIQEASAAGGARSISLADWQFLLQGELAVRGGTTILGLGAGQTFIGGNGQGRLFSVAADGRLALHGLALQGGVTGGDGGAIWNGGELALEDVQISGNEAGGRGGAIWNGGDLTAFDSSVTGNSAGAGAGGIANSGELLLRNVTISGNRGASGGLANEGAAVLNSVTVSRNHATAQGGGIRDDAGALAARNALLAGNTSDGAGPDCSGGFTSRGHNLLGDTGGCAIAQRRATDLSGQEAWLAPLSLNGGSTFGHAPQGHSPAVEAGACDLPVDQRGVARPVDGNLDGRAACDIGAVEFEPGQVWLPLLRR